jgi:hypothetical protein
VSAVSVALYKSEETCNVESLTVNVHGTASVGICLASLLVGGVGILYIDTRYQEGSVKSGSR